jgi:hypothetical protein
MPGLNTGNAATGNGLKLDLTKARDLQENMAKKQVDTMNDKIKVNMTAE